MRSIASAAELERAVAQFVAFLSAELRVERVILFGSYVRGAAHEWSDIDLAVVSPDFEGIPVSKWQERLAVLSLDRDQRIVPIGYAPSEYRAPRPHSFLVEILGTGRTVYQGSGKGRVAV